MKIKFLISVLLIAFILLIDTGIAIASRTDEIFADWEKSADSRIWGSKVLNSINLYSGQKLSVNSFCDYETIKKVNELREMALKELEKYIEEGRSDSLTEIYAVMLKYYSEIAPNLVSKYERKLISKAFSYRKMSLNIAESLSNGKTSKENPVFICSTGIGIITVQNTDYSFVCTRANHKNNKKDNFKNNLNLNDYSTRTSKINYFSLFLYIWEGNPKVHAINSYNTLLPEYSFVIHFSPFSVNKISQPTTSLNINQNHNNKSERSIVLFCRNAINPLWPTASSPLAGGAICAAVEFLPETIDEPVYADLNFAASEYRSLKKDNFIKKENHV